MQTNHQTHKDSPAQEALSIQDLDNMPQWNIQRNVGKGKGIVETSVFTQIYNHIGLRPG